MQVFQPNKFLQLSTGILKLELCRLFFAIICDESYFMNKNYHYLFIVPLSYITEPLSYSLLTHLVTMLHKFCEVEQGLRDLWDILRLECELQGAEQVILKCLIHLAPHCHERYVEQIPGYLGVARRDWVHGPGGDICGEHYSSTPYKSVVNTTALRPISLW